MPRPLARWSLLALVVLVARADAQPLDADARRDAVARLADELEARYVFPDVGTEAAAHVEAQLAAGSYDELDDADAFAERLTADLQSVTHDKHLNVWLTPEGTDSADQKALARLRERHAIERNFGFARVERLDGNVGYLDLRGFYPTDVAAETALAALRLLDGADALVVDLRQNGGGDPDMVRFLLTHLFAERTHLNSLYWRETGETEEFWTLDERPGPDLSDLPLVVLTSARTFSGGEEFAYDVQTRQRGTLVGETTGGGANPGAAFPIGRAFQVFMPMGRAANPVTGTNWEGVGVVPDVATSAEAAYDRGLEIARAAAEKRQESRDL